MKIAKPCLDLSSDVSNLWKDIVAKEPLPIKTGQGDESGHMEPFNEESFKVAMQERGVYRCAGNLFWLSLLHISSPKVCSGRG